jgi:hypothetical protein
MIIAKMGQQLHGEFRVQTVPNAVYTLWERSRMLRTHRVSVSFKPIARPPERRGRHRVWSADSARGWDLLPAGLLDSSVLQVLAHARARTCLALALLPRACRPRPRSGVCIDGRLAGHQRL